MNMNEPKLGAYVLKPMDKSWKTVTVTEYMSDGTWVSGFNMITSLTDAVKTAEEEGVGIIFESMLEKEENEDNYA